MEGEGRIISMHHRQVWKCERTNLTKKKQAIFSSPICDSRGELEGHCPKQNKPGIAILYDFILGVL